MRLILILAFIGTCLSAETSDDKTTAQSTTAVSTASVTPTPAPISTTTVAPPPTPALLHFNLTNSAGNATCAIFEFEAVVEMKLANTTEKKIVTLLNTTVIDLNKSDCSENSTYIYLNINGETNEHLYLKLQRLESTYVMDHVAFVNGTDEYETNKTSISIDNKKSYLCQSEQEIELLKSQNEITTATLVLTNLKIDAFRKKDDGNEIRAEIQECEADYPQNDFVPLAVGCALISLVFIVLIAYIVGRKRSRRLTYQSV